MTEPWQPQWSRDGYAISYGTASSGIDVRVVRDGLKVGAWYGHGVGIEGMLIPWEEIDRLRLRRKRRKRLTIEAP